MMQIPLSSKVPRAFSRLRILSFPLWLSALCLFPPALSAQQVDPADAEEPATEEADLPDYGPALEVFFELGLPRLPENAEWGVTEGMAEYVGQTQEETWGGGMWKIPAEGENPAQLVYGQCYLRPLAEQDTDDETMAGMSDEWQSADLDADLALVIKSLQVPDEEQYLDEATLGQYLLLAVHARQQGKAAAANHLVHQLLTIAGSEEDMIKPALNLLATAHYLRAVDAMEALPEDFEPKARLEQLAGDLQQIIDLFGTELVATSAFQELLANLRGNPPLSGEPPALPTNPEAPDLTEDLRRLLNNGPENLMVIDYMGFENWLFTSSQIEEFKESVTDYPEAYAEYGIGNVEDLSVLPILEAGVEALPVLWELAEDPTFLPILTSTGETRPLLLSQYEYVLTDPEMGALPIQRKNVALRLLQPLLPDNLQYNYSDTDNFTHNRMIIAHVKEIYRLWKEESPVAVAKMALENAEYGYSQMVDTLWQSIANDHPLSAEFRELLHQYFLNQVRGEYRDQAITSLSGYLDQLSSADREFLQQFLELAEKSPSAEGEEYVQNALASLKLFAEDKSVETLMAEIAADPDSAASAGQVLSARLNELPHDEVIETVLTTLLETSSPTLGQFLGYYLTIKQSDESRWPEDYDYRSHGDLWQKAFQDQRPFSAYITLGSTLLQQSFPFSSEKREAAGQSIYYWQPVYLGPDMEDFMRDYAAKYFAEEPLPDLPLMENADQEKLDRLLATDAPETLGAEKYLQEVKSLNLPDRMAFIHDLQENRDHPAHKILGKAVLQVGKVHLKEDGGSLDLSFFQKLEGQTLTLETLRQMIETSQSMLAQKDMLQVMFVGSPFDDGNLYCTVSTDAAASPLTRGWGNWRNNSLGGRGILTCTVNAHSTNASANWVVGEALAQPAAAEDSALEDSDRLDSGVMYGTYRRSDSYTMMAERFEEQQKEFWETLEPYFAEPNSAFVTMQLLLIPGEMPEDVAEADAE